MNNQLIMENYLLVLKSTVEVYVHGTLESSNQDMISLLNSGLNSILDAQARTYAKMTECGWYTVDNVDVSSIQKVLDKVSSNMN